MKRMLVFPVYLIIGLILQITLFSHFTINNVKPDILLTIVVVISLLSGSKYGILAGFFAGTLQDLYLGGVLGIYTIIKMSLGGLTGFVEGHFFKENYLLAPAAVFTVTFIHHMLVILLSEKMIFNINLWQALRTIVIPEALYNAVLGLIIYYILYKLHFTTGVREYG